MGKTVESFRIALEGEINRWSGFARSDREAFGEMNNQRKNRGKDYNF